MNSSSDISEREEQFGAIIFAYLEALESQQETDPQQWLTRYPEFADELLDFLQSENAVQRYTQPLGHIVQAVRAEVEDQHPTPIPHIEQPARPLPAPLADVLDDYEILEDIGRGGMSVVYKARQKSLGRVVALKMIHAGDQASQDDLRRFRNEGEMVAALDHPNIIPIYEVGEQQGQVYLSLKWIEGGSLDAQVDLYRTDNRRAAKLIAQVALAVHHAHQHGILHRDLKPSNILLDKAGQPYVTDFGLARRMETDSSLTQSGAIVGTPSYMAPEQATGEKGAVTITTDVFGLGSVLYALLTGRAPFQADNILQSLALVKECQPPQPGRYNGKLDRDLETICLKCLEKEPQNRYPSAKDLADDLRYYLEDQPIKARRPSLAQQVRRWGRRHQALVWAVAACLLVGLTVLAGSVGWVARDSMIRHKKMAHAASADLAEAENLYEQGKYDKAFAAVRRARANLPSGTGSAELLEQVNQWQIDLEMRDRLERIHLDASPVKNQGFDWQEKAPRYAAAFSRYRIDVQSLPEEEAIRRLGERHIRMELAAALMDWALLKDVPKALRKNLLTVANRLDREPHRQPVWQALIRSDRKELVRLADQKNILTWPALSLSKLASGLINSGAVEEARDLLSQALRRYPGDFWLNHSLADVFHRRLKPAQMDLAVEYARAAVAARPQCPGAILNLGYKLVDSKTNRIDEAQACFERAILLKSDYATAYNNLGALLSNYKNDQNGAIKNFKKAIALQPDYVSAHFNLGVALSRQGKFTDAISCYRKVIAYDRNYVSAYSNLANALEAQKKFDEAIVYYQKAIALRPNHAGVRIGLGSVLKKLKRYDQAIAVFRQAIQIEKNYPPAYFNLGVALKAQGRLDEAIAAYQQAIQLKKTYYEAHNNLGSALLQKGQVDAAIASYQQAIRLNKDFANAHYNLGLSWMRKGMPDEAIVAFRDAVRLEKDRPEYYFNLGNALKQKWLLKEAVTAYREAIRLKEDFAEAHCNLGFALSRQGDFKQALVAHRRGHELGSRRPNWRYPSARWLEDCQKFATLAEKLKPYELAMVIGPDGISVRTQRTPHAEKRIEGKITDKSPIQFGRYFARHKIKLNAQRAYIMDLLSTDFQPLLFLKNSQGQTVDRDKNSGTGWNARLLRVTGNQAEEYTVEIVGPRANTTGAYTFILREFTLPPALKAAM